MDRCSTVDSALAFSETVLGKSLCEKLVIAEVEALWDLWQGCNREVSVGPLTGSTASDPPTTATTVSSSDQTKHLPDTISGPSESRTGGAPIPDATIQAAIPKRLSQLERARVTVELVSSGGLGKKLAKMSSGIGTQQAEAAAEGGGGGMAFELLGRMAVAASAVVKVWKARLKTSK